MKHKVDAGAWCGQLGPSNGQEGVPKTTCDQLLGDFLDKMSADAIARSELGVVLDDAPERLFLDSVAERRVFRVFTQALESGGAWSHRALKGLSTLSFRHRAPQDVESAMLPYARAVAAWLLDSRTVDPAIRQCAFLFLGHILFHHDDFAVPVAESYLEDFHLLDVLCVFLTDVENMNNVPTALYRGAIQAVTMLLHNCTCFRAAVSNDLAALSALSGLVRVCPFESFDLLRYLWNDRYAIDKSTVMAAPLSSGRDTVLPVQTMADDNDLADWAKRWSAMFSDVFDAVLEEAKGRVVEDLLVQEPVLKLAVVMHWAARKIDVAMEVLFAFQVHSLVPIDCNVDVGTERGTIGKTHAHFLPDPSTQLDGPGTKTLSGIFSSLRSSDVGLDFKSAVAEADRIVHVYDQTIVRASFLKLSGPLNGLKVEAADLDRFRLWWTPISQKIAVECGWWSTQAVDPFSAASILFASSRSALDKGQLGSKFDGVVWLPVPMAKACTILGLVTAAEDEAGWNYLVANDLQGILRYVHPQGNRIRERFRCSKVPDSLDSGLALVGIRSHPQHQLHVANDNVDGFDVLLPGHCSSTTQYIDLARFFSRACAFVFVSDW